MKRKMMYMAFMIFFLISSLTGCAMFNEGSLEINRCTTIGQELMDLQEAKDKGVISEEEYDRLREKAMRGGLFDLGGDSKSSQKESEKN